MVNVYFISLEGKVHKSLCEWWSAASSVGVQLVLVRLDPLFSSTCGQILSVACGQALYDITEIILSFFEVSLSSDSRNHAAKKRRRCHYLKNRPSRPPMTVLFLTPAPLPPLEMSSCTSMICKVRAGAVKLKIFGLYGVQACDFLISLTAGFAVLDHFSPFPTKLFSPGPNWFFIIPSNSPWV